MKKITDINEFRSRRSPMAPTMRDSGALFWKEPKMDAASETLRGLPDDEMAAVLIKGLFAIYHLSDKHARLPRKVPDYLYSYALEFEEPIIPTAETLYLGHFQDVPFHIGDDILDDLYELGMGTAGNADSCVHHARQLHRFLTAFVDDTPQMERVFARLYQATSQPGRCCLLLPLFEGCRQWALDRQHLKPI